MPSNSVALLASRRLWVLRLLAACERYGLTPVHRDSLHEIAFMANSLAQVYDMSPPLPRLVRTTRGPIYPQLQWDLDRMSCQRLVEATDLRWTPDNSETLFSASYALSTRGLLLARSFAGLDRVNFSAEVVSAYADVIRGEDDLLASVDVTYSDESKGSSSLIDLSDETETIQLIDRLRAASRALTPSGRDAVHLYLRYINRTRGGAVAPAMA